MTITDFSISRQNPPKLSDGKEWIEVDEKQIRFAVFMWLINTVGVSYN